MKHISDEDAGILIQKYGVLDSFDKLKDERAINIVNSYGSFIPISEFYSSYQSVQNKLLDISNSSKVKGLDILLEYQKSIHQTIKNKLSEFASKKPKIISPSDLNFFLDVARNNLIYSIINYELTQSEYVTLPIQCVVIKGLVKENVTQYEFGICDIKYFFQKSIDSGFHNFNGEITERIGRSNLEFHSSIMNSLAHFFADVS